MPIVDSEMPSRPMSTGILGAQLPIRNPLVRNSSEIAMRSGRTPKRSGAALREELMPDMGITRKKAKRLAVIQPIAGAFARDIV
ncbi:hypothetical protein [Pelagibacterium lacus]|uniref:hypothetical protein n=1 Tax=Pelagibacterium lacus TaxID=2282655 RepID=UPI001FE89CD7|nr:hypothetical protein [Pelagibacterium lacus]